MTSVNIKEIVGHFDKAGIKYETLVERHEEPFHKHIHILLVGVIDRHFIKDADNNWYEGECNFCTAKQMTGLHG